MPRRPRPADEVAATLEPIRKLRRRVDQLEMPDGNQLFRALEKVQTLLADIGTYVDAYLASGFTTGSFTATGTAFLDLIDSLATYNRLVTGSGSFRTVAVNVLGHIGQTVSSRRYKQDIETAVIPRETLRKLRLVFFRYIANVPFDQEQQPWLLGLIAEEVHELGLTWLVIYNDAGEPEALVDFALQHLGLMLAQYDAEDIDDLRAEVVALRAEIGKLRA